MCFETIGVVVFAILLVVIGGRGQQQGQRPRRSDPNHPDFGW
jgi:hypothetical protein